MKSLIAPIGLLAALALGSAALAQPGETQPGPARLAAARHLIQTMHAERLADQVISAMETSVVASMPKSSPDGKQSNAQAFQGEMLEEMRTIMPKLFDHMASIYATDFTDDQLAEIDRFYASPTGQALLAEAPRMSQQIVPFVMAQMPDAIERAFDRSCRKTACTPEQRAAMAKAVAAMRARLGVRPG
jgi:hypothetical protein